MILRPLSVRVAKNSPTVVINNNKAEEVASVDESDRAKAFNFRELAMATKNFKPECLLGEGGIGRVYRGTLQSTGQVMDLQTAVSFSSISNNSTRRKQVSFSSTFLKKSTCYFSTGYGS